MRLELAIVMSVLFLIMIGVRPVWALTHDIAYTDNGFEPSAVVAKVTDTVRIVNQTQGDLDIFSTNIAADISTIRFQAGVVKPGNYTAVTLTEPGTYTFSNRKKIADKVMVTALERMTLIQLRGKIFESAETAPPTPTIAKSGSVASGSGVAVQLDAEKLNQAGDGVGSLLPMEGAARLQMMVSMWLFMITLGLMGVLIKQG